MLSRSGGAGDLSITYGLEGSPVHSGGPVVSIVYRSINESSTY